MRLLGFNLNLGCVNMTKNNFFGITVTLRKN